MYFSTRSLRLPLAAIAVLLATGAGCREASHTAPRPDARSAAGDDLVRPGGREYDASLGIYFMSHESDNVRSCLASSPPGRAPEPFVLFMTVDTDGSLSATSAEPPTPVGACMAANLAKHQLPRPPFAPFHAHMPMRFKG